MKAHQKLLLAHHSRPSFQNNLLLAYNILHKQKSKHYNLNDATVTCKPQLSQTPWLSGLVLLSHFNFMNIGKSAWRSEDVFVCSSFRNYLWVFFPFQREKVALTCTCYTLNIILLETWGQVLGPTSPRVTIEQILILICWAILHCKHDK